jgi:hypothetical protein
MVWFTRGIRRFRRAIMPTRAPLPLAAFAAICGYALAVSTAIAQGSPPPGTPVTAAEPTPRSPQQLEVSTGPAIFIRPTSYQVIHMIDGIMTLGPELPVPDVEPAVDYHELSFDRFMGDLNSSGFNPIGGDLPPCALQPTSRYFFGTGASMAHFVDEYSGAHQAQIGQPVSAIVFPWRHNPAAGEPMRIAAMFWNEFNSDCSGFAEGPDSIVAARGYQWGVLFTFNNGGPVSPILGMPFTFQDIRSLQLPSLPDTDGAIETMYVQTLDSDPNTPGNQIVWASRSSPFVWGTQPDFFPQPGPFPLRPGGASVASVWLDNGGPTPPANPNGRFTPADPDECDSWQYEVCIRPLGHSIAFFRPGAPPPPGPFSLLTPANGTRDFSVAPLLTWSPSAIASEYRVEISTSPTLANPVYVGTGITTNSHVVPVGVLLRCTTYYWGVTAINENVTNTRSTPVAFQYRTGRMIADFNRDGIVDFFDYLDFMSRFSLDNIQADWNRDRRVDFFDYLDFVSDYSQSCPD